MSNIKIGDHVGVDDASKYKDLRGLRGVVARIRSLYGRVEYEVRFKKKAEPVIIERWIPESDIVSVEDKPIRRCGARVRVIGNGHPVRHNAPIGSTGKIIHYGPCESLVVEFDEPIHEGSRTTKTQFVSPQDLELIKEEIDELANTNWKVMVTPDGDDTIAILYQNEKMERYARVRRFHEDTYDKSVAAIEAVKKLFGKQEKPEPEKPKGFTGKAVYKIRSRGNDFTFGKIYTFTDGQTFDDKGDLRPFNAIFGVIDESEQWICKNFIKVVE